MNIYDFPKGILPDELISVLYKNDEVSIERIISTGNVTPHGYWYDQDKNEYVVLVDGEARLDVMTSDDEYNEILLKRGDTTFIPAHVKHRVTYTSVEPACVWLCVFC